MTQNNLSPCDGNAAKLPQLGFVQQPFEGLALSRKYPFVTPLTGKFRSFRMGPSGDPLCRHCFMKR